MTDFADNMNIEKSTESRLSQVNFNKLGFGKTFTDHMVIIDHENGKWGTPSITPFQNLSISPSCVGLHYGQTVFEGMKAYRWEDNSVYAFRPLEHVKRLNISAERLCMATIPENLFMDSLAEHLKLDRNWIPQGKGCSLYIRPFMFANDEYLGVKPSEKYKFLIISSPVASYYSGTVKVLVEQEYVRASEGGTGFIKMGGNYSASLLPTKRAVEKGYTQILWTDSKEHKYIEESGTMNVMFQIGDTIITPELNTATLGGITRKSVVALAKEWGVKVEERKISVEEIAEAHAEGQLKDAFGTGTAATITHISHIGFNGKEMALPAVEERGFSNKAQQYLTDLKEGNAEDYMGWMHKIC